MTTRFLESDILLRGERNPAAWQTSPQIKVVAEREATEAMLKPPIAFWLTLPYPPSTNTYWRNIGPGRTILSEKARAYRKAVKAAAIVSKPLESRLKVTIELSPPDKRRRDLDNCCKGLFDSLQHAGVYLDDSQIDEFTIKRMPVVKGGRCEVLIEEL